MYNIFCTIEAGTAEFAYGLGFLFLAILIGVILMVIFVAIGRWFNLYYLKEKQYTVVELSCLRKLSEKFGFDINKEMNMLEISNGNTFRNKLEKQMIKEYFCKNKKQSEYNIDGKEKHETQETT